MANVKPKRVEGFIEIEHAQVIFKNFAGRERPPYNPAGYRNFCVVLDDKDLIDQLTDDGWNVKSRAPRDEEGEPLFYLPVKIGYNVRPPHVVMVSASGKQTELDEEGLDILDEVDIAYADIAVNPYNWEMRGNRGVSAYLKTGYFQLEKIPFAEKYSEDAQEPLPFDVEQ